MKGNEFPADDHLLDVITAIWSALTVETIQPSGGNESADFFG
jgi:hypothetical protein